MGGQKRIDRYYIAAKRMAGAALAGMRPSAIEGRLRGPRVLMNSIPKSGTNLLEAALKEFPMLRGRGGRTLMDWRMSNERVLKKVAGIKKGEYLAAHLPATPELIDVARKEGIKVLCMIRDPRDIVVSHFKYVSTIDLTHPCHNHFAALPDDDARLLASIKGVAGLHYPVNEVLQRYEGWLSDGNTLVVRFEDLVGPAGGGDAQRQFETVRDIGLHLGIVLDEDDVMRICRKTYSTKASTFRSGKAGGWRGCFKEEHKMVFKELAGDLMIRYGYEKDIDWR